MSLSVQELAQVLDELRPLVGAVVQNAFAPRERLLFLELRVPGRTDLLRIDATPNRTRIHLASSRPASPHEPLAIQQAARAHLVGRKLSAIESSASDRVVSLRFANDEGARTLVAELTGRHGNLFLLSENGNILALGGPNLSKLRPLAPGRAYQPPVSEPPTGGPASRFVPGPGFALSAQIDAAYAEREEAIDRAALRARLEKPVRAKLERLARTLKKVEAEASRTDAAEGHRVAGELLKTALHQVRRGASKVKLTDYASGEPREVEIALRPELSPADNLAWHFRQYRRLLQGSARAAQRLAQLREEHAVLEGQLQRIASLDAEALAVRAEALPIPPAPAKRGAPVERKPFREFRSANGAKIWVGKGATDNDALTFKIARPHDHWFHARGRTGAHVIVPLERREVLAPEVLLDACALAVHFSDARNEGHAEVSHVARKYVRKPKGSAAGAVLYNQEKTLNYLVEPARLARLLATAES